MTAKSSLARNGWRPWHAVGAVLLTAFGVAVQSDAWADIGCIAIHDEEASHSASEHIMRIPVRM